MNMRTIAAEYRMQRWAEIIKECKESGLSIRMYCKNAGIHENTYFYWQKKLRETVYNEMSKEQNKMIGLMPSYQSEASKPKQESPGYENVPLVKWAQVDTKSSNNTDTTNENSIKISRDGWTITIVAGIDTCLLTETLRAVKRACC